MDDKQAYDLTEKFMANFSMGGMISNIFSGLVGGDDEIGKKINEKIKKKLDEDDE
jgi:methylglyoxal synthase